MLTTRRIPLFMCLGCSTGDALERHEDPLKVIHSLVHLMIFPRTWTPVSSPFRGQVSFIDESGHHLVIEQPAPDSIQPLDVSEIAQLFQEGKKALVKRG